MAEHIELGKKGEELALRHLASKKYQILETNWRLGKNEIDIIARDGKYLVIAEVKTRQSDYFAEPEASVTREKQRALILAANAYVKQKNIHDEVRFDIISILISENREQINHIEDAFYPY